jgi:hypothetical protein
LLFQFNERCFGFNMKDSALWDVTLCDSHHTEREITDGQGATIKRQFSGVVTMTRTNRTIEDKHLLLQEPRTEIVQREKDIYIKQTPWPLVRERTIPTERPPLVNEI